MALPKILPTRLQRVVAEAEFETEFASFDELCEVVSKSAWATSFGFTPIVLGALMVAHQTATKVQKPVSVDMPEELSSAENDTNVVNTYDVGGKGKKQCPACRKYLGVRQGVCACGHKFVKGSQTKANADIEIEIESAIPIPTHIGTIAPVVSRARSVIKMIVHTPAGRCPHRLDGTDEKTVELWAEQVRKTFMDRDGSWLNLNALKCFVQQYYDIFDPSHGFAEDYLKIRATLDSLYGGEQVTAA